MNPKTLINWAVIVISIVIVILLTYFSQNPLVFAITTLCGILASLLQVDGFRRQFGLFLIAIYKDIVKILSSILSFFKFILDISLPLIKSKGLQILTVVIVFALLVILFFIPHMPLIRCFVPSPSPTSTPPLSDEAKRGLSDGSMSFYITPVNKEAKEQAEVEFRLFLQTKDENIRRHAIDMAKEQWEIASLLNPTDAEPLIYIEDQRITDMTTDYRTIIVVVTLNGTSDEIGEGRDILQGAYVAQREYNEQHPQTPLRLLIANVGSADQSASVQQVANQLVQAIADTKQHIVGIVGRLINSDLTRSLRGKIPMISSTPCLNQSQQMSNQLFSITSCVEDEASFAARFARTMTNQAAIVYDESDPGSQQMADAFKKQFQNESHSIKFIVPYTRGNLEIMFSNVNEYHPQDQLLFYVIGSADCIHSLREYLQKTYPYFSFPLISSHSFYQMIHSQKSNQYFYNTYFTSFAFHQTMTKRLPAGQVFLKRYAAAFDSQNEFAGNTYGHSVANDAVILAYDSTKVLLTALIQSQEQQISFVQALTNVTGVQDLQGLSGRIAFGPDAMPQDKSIFLLQFTPQGFRSVSESGRYCASSAGANCILD